MENSKNTAARANCFDASALVKLHVDEIGSDVIRQYADTEPTKYTTPFCFFEALNVLKVKWLYRKEISKEEYHDASLKLTSWFSLISKRIRDLDFIDPIVFVEVKKIAEQHSLDLSDAFQIVSVKKGFFSSLAHESKTILVTADEELANAARSEGIKVWYFLTEPRP
ncbi:MAG: PIN domain-containing protein [Nitrospirae bacterium]|nr:MAG: PIN domain-containing protein [Nitrospirota bacterium]